MATTTTPPPDTKVLSETLDADDLPYRIVEEMGLGLTFRSCTCGQLPCARLRPLRDALDTIRRDEREACARVADERAAFNRRLMKTHPIGDPMADLKSTRADEAEVIAGEIREGR